MPEIRVGENESLENALKRFKRKCAREQLMSEVRKREHYEKPSVKRKKKAFYSTPETIPCRNIEFWYTIFM